MLPRKPNIDKAVDSIKKEEKPELSKDIRFDKAVSTGSTLLDLAISGGRRRGGGVPGGILAEISGVPGIGKTALLCELGASAEKNHGQFKIADAEHRLDLYYAKTYGLNIDEDTLERPKTVSDVFKIIWDFEGSDNDAIDVIGVDSIASLTSSQELKEEEGDKRGQAKAKELHSLMRRTKQLVSEKRRLVVFTNQLIDDVGTSSFGPRTKTPGGYAIPYYSSLRLKVTRPMKGSQVKVERTIKGVKHERVIGIKSEVEVFKSTIDDPFRTAPVYIIFGHGIDDIRANLEFIKYNGKYDQYAVGDTNFGKLLPQAIHEVETNNLEEELREQVIDLWEEIQRNLTIERKTKRRR
jgi:protein RecA